MPHTAEVPLSLSERLVGGAFIDPDRLTEAEKIAEEREVPLQRELITGEYGVPPEIVATLLSFQYRDRAPLIDIALLRVPSGQNPVELIDGEFARARHVLPVTFGYDRENRRTLLLAMEDPSDAKTIAEVQEQTGMPVEPVISLRNLYEQIKVAYPINPA